LSSGQVAVTLFGVAERKTGIGVFNFVGKVILGGALGIKKAR
jgi:hypothetical protein